MIKCKICNREIDNKGMAAHLTKTHKMKSDEYVEKYGEFRPNKLKFQNRNIKGKFVECGICNESFSTRGMHTHLKDSHNGLTVDEYVKTYPEFRQKYIRRNNIKKDRGVICKICNDELHSDVMLSYHLKQNHDMDKIDYVRKYIFNDEPQLCECECGEEVEFLVSHPYRRRYRSGHNGSTTGYSFSEESKLKMSKSAIKRGITSTQKDTKIELHIKSILDNDNINYKPQCEHELGIIDFYLIDYDLYIEVDGKYWHKTEAIKLTHRQLSAFINDNRKNKSIKNLIRIREDDVYDIKTIDDILNYKTNNTSNIYYKKPIVHSEYIKIKKEHVKKNIWIYKKFLREFIDEYPYPFGDYNLEIIQSDIINKTLMYKPTGNVFDNNTSNVGAEYLKSTFKSYWKSKYKGNLSPYEVFNDDNKLTNIIKNRFGLHGNDEVYDFSIKNINRGISAYRHTISFFKPVVAARIYKYFIGDNDKPTVFDPCAGFGGRLLGFKSIYPNGTYIGLEPNIETYNELIELSKNFDNVTIINSKVEDYIDDYNFDLTFTSIPYYDTEIYSNHISYESIDEWVDKFIVNGINRFPNKLINFNNGLRQYFPQGIEYFLKNNTSHFNKKSNTKVEFILRY